MSNKRIRQYSTSLRKNNKCIIEPNGIYKTDKDKCFSSLNPLKVKVDGITFETYLSLYNTKVQEYNNAISYLDGCNSSITAFLIDNGYNTPNVEQMALIKDLLHLLVIKPNEEYELVQTNDDGYITKILSLNGEVINKQDKPVDILNGAYKLVNNKYILDENKLNELGAML